MAKISGYLTEANAKILVIREDTWVVEATKEATLGPYEFTGLTTGKKAIIAVSPEGEVVGYGAIDTVAE